MDESERGRERESGRESVGSERVQAAEKGLTMVHWSRRVIGEAEEYESLAFRNA